MGGEKNGRGVEGGRDGCDRRRGSGWWREEGRVSGRGRKEEGTADDGEKEGGWIMEEGRIDDGGKRDFCRRTGRALSGGKGGGRCSKGRKEGRKGGKVEK